MTDDPVEIPATRRDVPVEVIMSPVDKSAYFKNVSPWALEKVLAAFKGATFYVNGNLAVRGVYRVREVVDVLKRLGVGVTYNSTAERVLNDPDFKYRPLPTKKAKN